MHPITSWRKLFCLIQPCYQLTVLSARFKYAASLTLSCAAGTSPQAPSMYPCTHVVRGHDGLLTEGTASKQIFKGFIRL